MLTFRPSSRQLLAVALMTAGVGIGAAAPAGAEPVDYGRLPVDPNLITDSTAYIAEPPVLNPDGLTGVEQVFTHRDDSRHITETVLVLPDPRTAETTLQGLQANLGADVVGQTTQSVTVGNNGIVVSGTSPDGSQAVAVLLFTRGGTATEIQFAGPPADPVPLDLVTEYGQRQDDAIREQLNQ